MCHQRAMHLRTSYLCSESIIFLMPFLKTDFFCSMYFHAATLSLFRPFHYATILDSNVVPREICRTAANTISDLWQEHRTLYGLTGIYMFQVHCLLTACTIHIVNIPSLSSSRYLTYACNTFHDLIPRNEWAKTALETLRGLAEKWRLILPLDVEDALYRGSDRSQLARPDNVAEPGGGVQLRDHPMMDGNNRHYGSSSGHGVSNINAERQTTSLLRRRVVNELPRPELDGVHIPLKRGMLMSAQDQHVGGNYQKRQRVQTMQTSQNHPAALRYHHSDDTRNSSTYSTSRSESDTSPQQPYQGRSPTAVTSQLYSPLAHQGVPLLQPVIRSIPNTNTGTSSTSSTANDRADPTNPSSMSHIRASSSSSSLGRSRDGRPVYGIGSGRVDGAVPSVRQLRDRVDGLSFAEDWRNPFIHIPDGAN